MALLLGVAVVVVGPGALAQEATTTSTTSPPGVHRIDVTPDTVTAPLQEITLSGNGFPGQIGCVFGQLVALPAGQTSPVEAPRLLQGFDFDGPWSQVVTEFANGDNFFEGTFTLLLICRNNLDNDEVTYQTGATLTVTAAGVPPPDPTTTIPPPPTTTTTAAVTTTTIGTNGTVDPTTARAGQTTVTIRGNGFKALAKLDITLNTRRPTPLGTVNAFADGTYAATILIPANAPAGQHKLLVTGPGPDDVTRSTTADLRVLASSTGTGTNTRTAAATGSTGSTATLPATGPSESTPYFVMAGLTAMTLGAFLVGMSHPAVPSRGRHRRRRSGLRR